jgi:hypothetical protein
MAELTIMEGIVVGGFGGAAAGIVVYAVQHIHSSIQDKLDSNKIYTWLSANTSNEDGKRFRTTRAIASWTNLPEDRVRYLCSTHKQIFLSTGPNEDRWSFYGREHAPQIF